MGQHSCVHPTHPQVIQQVSRQVHTPEQPGHAMIPSSSLREALKVYVVRKSWCICTGCAAWLHESLSPGQPASQPDRPGPLEPSKPDRWRQP